MLEPCVVFVWGIGGNVLVIDKRYSFCLDVAVCVLKFGIEQRVNFVVIEGNEVAVPVLETRVAKMELTETRI